MLSKLKKAIKLLAKSIYDMSFEDIPSDYVGIGATTEDYLRYFAIEKGHDPYDYPKEEINEDNPEFKEWLQYEIEGKYMDINQILRKYINSDRTIDIYRAMTVSENWLDHLAQQGKHLGIYWSYEEDAVEAYWARKEQQEVIIHGRVPETSIDWETTFMLNMDMHLGEEEKEIRLHEGVPVEIVEVSINEEEQDISALEGRSFYA